MQNNNRNWDLTILKDIEENDPINNFKNISSGLTTIILDSSPNCIGIISDWGTGKSTLMKSIENNLLENVMKCNEIPKYKNQLINFLNKEFDLDWKIDDIAIIQKKGNHIIQNLNKNESVQLICDLQYSFKSKVTKSKCKKLSLIIKTLEKIINHLNSRIKLSKHIEIKMYKYLKDLFKIDLSVRFQYKDREITKFSYIAENDINICLYRDVNLLIVNFNPWKYEFEENRALIPLLKTLVYAIDKNFQFEALKYVLIKSIKVSTNIIGNYFNLNLKEVYEELAKKRVIFNKNDKDTIFYDGGKILENNLENIKKSSSGINSKIVVFIDDIDRCSPNKVLEVFESVKVLLNIPNIVFVVGLDDKIIRKQLEKQYESIGFVNLEERERLSKNYLEKIFGFQFSGIVWNKETIQELIKHLYEKSTDNIGDIVKESREDISIICQSNPRNSKNFLLSYHSQCLIFDFTTRDDLQKCLLIYSLFYILGKERMSIFIDNMKNDNFRNYFFNIFI